VLGAIADYAGVKKKMMAVTVALGVLVTAGLFFVGRGDWKLGLALFIFGNIFINASFVFIVIHESGRSIASALVARAKLNTSPTATARTKGRTLLICLPPAGPSMSLCWECQEKCQQQSHAESMT